MEEVEVIKGRPFCIDPFWDLNITWNVEEGPDFTTCFHQTILEYIPLAILLLLFPIEYNYLKKSLDRGIIPNLITYTRILINLLAAIAPLSVYINNLAHGIGFKDTAALLSPIVRCFGYVLAFIIYKLNLKNGSVSSGTLFIYWLVHLVTGGLTLASVLRGDLGEKLDKYSSAEYVVEYALVCCMFFLSFWADPMPEYKYNEGE